MRVSVYLYERTGGGWSCSSCPLRGATKEHVCVDPVGLARHMITHRDNGHVIPEWTLQHIADYERLKRPLGGPRGLVRPQVA